MSSEEPTAKIPCVFDGCEDAGVHTFTAKVVEVAEHNDWKLREGVTTVCARHRSERIEYVCATCEKHVREKFGVRVRDVFDVTGIFEAVDLDLPGNGVAGFKVLLCLACDRRASRLGDSKAMRAYKAVGHEQRREAAAAAQRERTATLSANRKIARDTRATTLRQLEELQRPMRAERADNAKTAMSPEMRHDMVYFMFNNFMRVEGRSYHKAVELTAQGCNYSAKYVRQIVGDQDEIFDQDDLDEEAADNDEARGMATNARWYRLTKSSELRERMHDWMTERKNTQKTDVSINELVERVNIIVSDVLPEEVKSQAGIGKKTVIRYMEAVFHIHYRARINSIYIDGHEKEEVVKARRAFVRFIRTLHPYMTLHVQLRDGGELVHADKLNDEQLDKLNPENFIIRDVKDGKRVVVLWHDEAVLHVGDRSRYGWFDDLGIYTKPRSKSKGDRIHMSGYIHLFGLLRVSDSIKRDEIAKRTHERRVAAGLEKAATARRGTKQEQITRLRGYKDGIAIQVDGPEVTWNNDLLVDQAMTVIEMCKAEFGDDTKVYCVYDNAPSHHKMAGDALNSDLIKTRGGQILLKGETTCTHKETGVVFTQQLNKTLPDGTVVPRTLQEICVERGHLVQGLTADAMRTLLDEDDDFKDQKSLIQQLWEAAGYEVLYLPKFHPELNGIEQLWSWIKESCRKISTGKIDDTVAHLNSLIDQVVSGGPQWRIIFRFLRHARSCARLYDKGMTGEQVLGKGAQSRHRNHKVVIPRTPPREIIIGQTHDLIYNALRRSDYHGIDMPKAYVAIDMRTAVGKRKASEPTVNTVPTEALPPPAAAPRPAPVEQPAPSSAPQAAPAVLNKRRHYATKPAGPVRLATPVAPRPSDLPPIVLPARFYAHGPPLAPQAAPGARLAYKSSARAPPSPQLSVPAPVARTALTSAARFCAVAAGTAPPPASNSVVTPVKPGSRSRPAPSSAGAAPDPRVMLQTPAECPPTRASQAPPAPTPVGRRNPSREGRPKRKLTELSDDEGDERLSPPPPKRRDDRPSKPLNNGRNYSL